MSHTQIAIIGAGLAGLAAANALPADSYSIFEKSRGPGGRLASKRIAESRADIGAQFFTVRDPRFESIITDAIAAGAANKWQPRMGKIVNSEVVASPDSQQRYVGTPYMNALAHYLAENITIAYETRFDKVTSINNHFVLTTKDGKNFTADQVLVTTPASQMADLLQDFDPHLISVEFEMDPTWTSVFEIQAQLKTTDGEYLDACFGGRHPAIDFVAMECSKPRRASNYLVVHAKPDFSKNHLDASTNDILFRIKHEFEKVFNIKAKPVLSHRWRFARPKYPGKTSQKGVYKLAPNLWLAGDYLAGGRVEGAYLSGLEAAARLRCCL